MDEVVLEIAEGSTRRLRDAPKATLQYLGFPRSILIATASHRRYQYNNQDRVLGCPANLRSLISEMETNGVVNLTLNSHTWECDWSARRK